MDNKVLDMLEKLFIEVKGVKSSQEILSNEVQGIKNGQEILSNEVQGISNEVQGIKSGQEILSNEVQGISNQMVRFENGMKEDIKALYDGYKQTYELVKENNQKLTELEKKVEKQEVEIKVIKGGKR